jgi:hypothetical protein
MPKKPKRLNITKDDRVTGVLPRQKVDLFAGCNQPGTPWFQRDDYEFMKIHCRICKNADCVRAKGAISPWLTRMAEQVDYLLNDPQFSDLTSEQHRNLAQMAFDDISKKAMRLEIARQRQDWTIPDGPTDGVDKVAAPETTDQFDDAVRALAEAKGKKSPELARPQKADGPAHFEAEESEPEPKEGSEWEYDTQYPSSDGKRTYRVTLSKQGAWRCECDGFKHRERCKHLNTVRAWYEEQVRITEEQERRDAEEAVRSNPRQGQSPSTLPAPTSDPRVPDTRYNTPMPSGGVMVGGGMPPPNTHQQPTRQEPKDPWAPRKNKATVVSPGAVVTLKGDKKNG